MNKKNPIKERIKLPFKKSHAFIIGINDYRRLSKLRTAINDAKKLAEVLAKEQGFNVHPPLLNAGREEIRQLLEKTMPEKIKTGDRCLLYFAGHGIAEENKGEEIPEGYLLPADAERDKVSGYYAMKDLYAAIRKLKCQHFLLILDCCFAGVFKWWTRYRQIIPLMPKRIFKERYDRFVKDPAWQVITSAASDQRAVDISLERAIGKRDDNQMDHSPFAMALFEGLKGEADVIPPGKGDGLITATELYLYLRDRLEPQTIAINENLRQTPGIFPLEKHDKGEYVFINPRHPLTLPPIPDRNPYKGLQSFEETDTDLFYGRERVIKDLMKKIRSNNLLVVTGASGTGKSSVVNAGLIPKLRQQGYDIQVIRPGETPTLFLEKALKKLKILKRRVSLSSDMEIVRGTITLTKAALIIDQYEELITKGCKEDDRNRFVRVLKVLLEVGGNDLFKIILTVSADFIPQRNGLELQPYWQKGMYMVPPLNSGELREIILMPAEQAVMEFEPSNFVETIFEDFNKAPGALPLLSFTLDELFRSSIETGRILRKSDYKELGDQESPLYKHTENMAGSLSDAEKKTFRKIIMRFVFIKENKLVGRKVSRDELDFSEAENVFRRKIINILLHERLIVEHLNVDTRRNNQPKQKESIHHTAEGSHPGKEESAYEAAKDSQSTELELAHPALIDIFKKLEFLPKDEEINLPEKHEIKWLKLQNSLADTVKEYRIKKDKDLLWYRGHRFKLLKNELESPGSFLNKNEVEFARAGIKLKKRKIKNIWAIAVSVIIILSFLSMFALNKARTGRANVYIMQAQAKINQHPSIPLRYAEKAYSLDRNKTVLRVLSAAAASTLAHPLYNINITHTHHVNDAKFSPTGDLILTSSSDKTAKLWDLKGRLRVSFNHETAVFSGEFSPVGDRVLTVSRDNSARLWDLEGRLLQRFTHPQRVTAAHFSPGGSMILTTCADSPATLWDVQGHLLRVFDGEGIVTYANFSPDSRMLLTVSDVPIAKLWDIQGRLIGYFDKHKDIITSAVFSSDGTHILTASRDTTAKLWDRHGNLIADFDKHKDMVAFALFSPDGESVFTVYSEGTVKHWDLHGNPLGTFKHKGIVTSATFSPDGSFILTASTDKTAKLWDLGGNLTAAFDMHADRVNSAVFSTDGTKILTASRDNTAKLWDRRDQLAIEFNRYKEEVTYAVFSPDGTKILTLSRDNQVKLLDLHSSREVVMTQHTKYINSASFSPDGRLILTASADKTAKLWNLRGALLHDLNRHTANVNSAVFSPDGRSILTASYDGTAKLWDLQGNLLLNLSKHASALTSAVFSPGGQQIFTASFDKTAKLWDLQGNCLQEFSLHSFPVEAVAFSPDGTSIITVSVVGRRWDLDGQPLAEFDSRLDPFARRDVQNDFGVIFACFSPGGKKVLTVSKDNKAKLWNLEGKRLAEFSGHKGEIYSAVFSPDGMRVLTASADHTTKLWDLKGNLLADFNKHNGRVYSAVFSPDGTRIVTSSADKTVKLWYTPEGIIQWLKKTKIPGLTPEENDNKW